MVLGWKGCLEGIRVSCCDLEILYERDFMAEPSSSLADKSISIAKELARFLLERIPRNKR